MLKKKKKQTSTENIFKKESNNKIAIILGVFMLLLMAIPAFLEIFWILLNAFREPKKEKI
jgi:uncharacterized membrane protein